MWLVFKVSHQNMVVFLITEAVLNPSNSGYDVMCASSICASLSLLDRAPVHGDGVHVPWRPPGIPASLSGPSRHVYYLSWKPLPTSLTPALFKRPAQHGHQDSQWHVLSR